MADAMIAVSGKPRATMNARTRADARSSSAAASGRVAFWTSTLPFQVARSLVIGLRADPVTVISSPARRSRSTAMLPMKDEMTSPAAMAVRP